MAITNEQKNKLLETTGLVAIGDLLNVDERTKGQDTYYTLNLVVGSSTERFELRAVDAGMLKQASRYSRVIVRFDTITFQKSGMTVKRAQEVLIG